jgi:cardiolipin synthase (CMP-forming)
VNAPKSHKKTFTWLVGLDRTKPAPQETSADQPWRPWTIPNLIGYIRLALIPVFLVLAFSSSDGKDMGAAIVFLIIAFADYLDGVAARLTGQYSRLGALLDPLIDRLLIISGVIVCWHFSLLPRWALALLFVREIAMILFVRWGMSRGLQVRINWFGRLGVWPIMAAPLFAMLGVHWLAVTLLYIGLVFVIIATVMYFRDGYRQVKAKKG